MMKHQGSSYCYCWFTLILVATGIVLVSPDIHTTFADNKRQTTKATGSQATTATTTLNTMRTIKTLESIGFIDANRYNANKYNHSSNNNNNNVNSYNISMDVVYSIRGNNNKNSSMNVKKNNLKSKRTNIDIPIDGAWSERLKEELEHIEQFELLEQSKERRAEHDAEHMLSTPQTMTIIVEEPTMIKHATTTIATSKPTTAITMTTTATNVIHTHSDSAIKMPTPANSANINVNGIKKDSMIYKQMSSCKQHEQQKQEPAKEKRTQQHWPNWQEERQRQQRLQRQSKAQSTWSSRKEQKSQTNVAISGLGSKTVTTTTTTAPMNTDARLTKATLQMQMAINSSNNSTLNFYSNTANKTLIQTTTVPTMLTTASNATITTTTTKKSQSQSFINISYYKTATNNNGNNIKSKVAQEADVKMVVAGLETTAAVEVDMEMEVDRQYQHKFSSSYLDENESNNKTNNKHNSVDVEHNYALRWQETPTALPLALLHTQHSNRWTRQLPADEEEPVDKCRQFIEGEGEKNEFYSPDYPNDYPKNINCTRKIIAPRGQIIRLDFRNSFHIEAKEDCKFDFLEIRDGQYGFSPLIGKFCGTDFPPEITSKERYLWLHFHSDESIEYSGFTAVYEFIDRSKEAPTTDLNCTIEKDGFEGFVNSSDVPYDIRETVIRTKIPLDCIWRIQVQDNWKIQVKFLDFKLSKPNDCDTNFLDIFPEKTVMPLRLKNFCGSAGEGITSESNVLNLRFFAEPAAINSTFAILYTAFRDRGAACTEDEYDCEDATCISQELKCNQRDNCKFRWDEEGCDKQSSEQSEHMIIIMIVFGLILGGMIVTFLVNCIRKIMHDQKIIREHIRQSKESKLNELGRNSKARSRDNLTSTMTSESLFATTPSLTHQGSMGSLKDKTSLHSRSRFSTFGYEAPPQPTPPALPAGGRSQMMGLNIRDAQGYIEMRERHPAPKPSMPHMHHIDALPPTPPTAATLPEMCHHHHQHAHTHVHTQQQQHQQATTHQQLSMQRQQQQSKENITTGRSTTTATITASTATPAQGKGKPKLSQSTAYIDIRNSAPDVIIMTSH
ncbi:uncharacterized protein Neto isoform X3 [Eurosta solidaginis]|uniref:uncharacterized protein Neto isoform X3 n=1 Tax=Eurosta solidaginis TaxID=178769 RepID=UPI0035306A26